MDINNVENIIKAQAIAFDEVIYYLTEEGLPAGQRLQRIDNVRSRANKILADMMKYRTTLSDQVSIDRVNAFIKEKSIFFNEKMQTITSTFDPSAEYGTEIFNASNKAQIPAALVGASNAPTQPTRQDLPFTPKQSVQQQAEPSVSMYNTSSAIDGIMMNRALSLNFSLGFVTKDGEDGIPSTATDLIYVIDPETKDNQIEVTRFMTPEKATEFVYNNFKDLNVQPLIIKGALARVKTTINLEV